MLPVVTADEMRALDRATIEDVGIPAVTLMETAGRAVADVAQRVLGPGRGRVAVVCGPGNNGGDGFVAARVLRDRGHDAVVYLAVPRDLIRGDAAAHLAILERSGGVIRALSTRAELEEVGADVVGAALVVDAVFGIGTQRPIEGVLAEVIALVNRATCRLAVDVPSGLDADTGHAPGPVVDAHHTVAMAALKVAHVSAPGFLRCGQVEVAEIGIPGPVLATANPRTGLVEEADVRTRLPRSSALDHKGRRGHVVVIGGGDGMRGAGRLAAIAALRGGAGLVTLATNGGPDAGAPDAVMTATLGADLGALLARKAAVVIGCGLGGSAAARSQVTAVLASGVAAVLDADALNALGTDLARVAAAAGPIVITPHPGEAARLLGTTAAAVEADRLAAARALAARTRAVVVLKGARTVICDGALEGDHCAVNPTGGPALATAGSGDVLAGTIGALLAQGLAPEDAAIVAVFAHGRAGDQLGLAHGRGVIASDLPEEIASVLQRLTR